MTYQTIKKFLEEGGKCLLIENGKPIGVVLTMEEYELLRSKSSSFAKASEDKQIRNPRPQSPSDSLGGRAKSETNSEAEKSLIPETDEKISISEIDTAKPNTNPIGAAMVEEMDFPSASANIDEINLADAGDVTLEDLGLDSDMELPKDF